MHAEVIRDFLHGVDAGEKGAGHGLAAVRISALDEGERLGKRTALGPGDFAQTLRRQGRPGGPLDEAVAAEEHLMTQPFPDARLPQSLGNELGVTGLALVPLIAELAEEPVRLQPGGRGR